MHGHAQVTNFLLHGEYDQGRELERMLLGKASR
jgi:hypothetical protein